jgi:hypothetical protein
VYACVLQAAAAFFPFYTYEYIIPNRVSCIYNAGEIEKQCIVRRYIMLSNIPNLLVLTRVHHAATRVKLL